jgi:N-acetylglutamate synthase
MRPNALDSTDPRLLDRCHENIVEAFRLYARARPQGRIEEGRDAVRIASGLKSPPFNPVFVSGVPSDPRATVEESARFMSTAGASQWCLVARGDAADAVAPHVARVGLTERHDQPGMLLRSIPRVAPPLPPDFRIRRATSLELWEEMLRIGARGFTGHEPRDVLSRFPFKLADSICGYVGYFRGTPVAIGRGLHHRGVCGVFSVTTLPGFRGRGMGAAMTWRVCVDGRKAGARVAFLQASELGLPVYSGMGFETVMQYTHWRTA